MTPCDRIRADAPGLMSLRRDDPERIAALSHASSCVECARALREAERLQSLLDAVEPEPLPAGALERAAREIRAQLRREARRRLVGSVAGVGASAAVFVGFARARSPSLADWASASRALASASSARASASRTRDSAWARWRLASSSAARA